MPDAVALSGATSRNARAAASAAASRDGWTSVAAIEREVSIASTTVASSRGTESVARGRATPTMSARQRDEREQRAAGSRRIRRGAGDEAATSAGVPEARALRLAPALADDEQHDERPGSRAGRASASGRAEAHRRCLRR